MPLCEACPPGRYPPLLLTLLILLSFFRGPDLRHRLMGEPLWNFHLGIPTDDPPLFKNLIFADGIVRFAGGEPTEEAKAIFAFIPKLRRTFLSTPPRSGAITVGSRVTFYPNCFAVGSRYGLPRLLRSPCGERLTL